MLSVQLPKFKTTLRSWRTSWTRCRRIKEVCVISLVVFEVVNNWWQFNSSPSLIVSPLNDAPVWPLCSNFSFVFCSSSSRRYRGSEEPADGAEERNGREKRCCHCHVNFSSKKISYNLSSACFHVHSAKYICPREYKSLFSDACPLNDTWTSLGTGCYLFFTGLTLQPYRL